MEKKAPRITLEQVVKLLTHLTKTLGELSLRVEKMDKKPARAKEWADIELACIKYSLHRYLKHQNVGIHRALNDEDIKIIKKMIE